MCGLAPAFDRLVKNVLATASFTASFQVRVISTQA